MKTIRRLKFTVITLILIVLLTACKSGVDKYELSNYIGKSTSTFEKRSGTELINQSNGVFTTEGVVQVMVPDKKITSITLLRNAEQYTLFGISIGMKKAAADALIKDIFDKAVSETKDSVENTATYSYLKDEKQLYVTYDLDKNSVIEASFYKISAEEQKAADKAELPDSGKMMLMVGDTKVYYNEAMVYLKSAQDKYEADYGDGIWNADILGNGKTFGKMLKDEVINQITELKIIHSEAEKQKIVLTEEELAEANSYAKEHYEGLSDEDKQRYMITEELLQQVYSDNLLADKVFENVTINVDTQVPSDDSKQITVQDIFIQNYNLDTEGKKVALADEDKKEAYDKVKSLLKQAKDTEDFKILAEANSEAKEIEYTFGKGGAPKEFGETFEKAAFSLKTGKISKIIETDTGWHIIYCVSDFNEDATIQVQENIIEQRRNDMFSELYNKWSGDYELVVNEEAWNAISLGE